MSPVWRGRSGPWPGSSRPVSSSQRPLLAGDVRVRTIRILAGSELARVHREDAVVVPDGVDRFREEVHLDVDDHSNDEGADIDLVRGPRPEHLELGAIHLQRKCISSKRAEHNRTHFHKRRINAPS